METVVDMETLPGQKDYASWAFFGSGTENHWNDFDTFADDFIRAGEFLNKTLPKHKESATGDRLRLACSMNKTIADQEIDKIVEKLNSRYCEQYYSKCIVHEDVFEVLPELSKNYKLGIVSNFKIENGIETILDKFNLKSHFDFIVTSIKTGWRKPHTEIYKAAIDLAHCPTEKMLFLGDDFENDVEAPSALGMKTLLLDRRNRYRNKANNHSINNFIELQDALLDF